MSDIEKASDDEVAGAIGLVGHTRKYKKYLEAVQALKEGEGLRMPPPEAGSIKNLKQAIYQRLYIRQIHTQYVLTEREGYLLVVRRITPPKEGTSPDDAGARHANAIAAAIVVSPDASTLFATDPDAFTAACLMYHDHLSAAQARELAALRGRDAGHERAVNDPGQPPDG